ncbi:hypothetical protein [Lentilactobacillus sp. Marseille-Q4993]|uniref:hypothetical protein n=1 Tax=Lentilactobacillus sp. Marseille-Q4993 TaxID=3039492 RepID=UPI0024BBFF5F|nr:hypothetical protein [Lentilactobacillus sp. Marseille-Q4993]
MNDSDYVDSVLAKLPADNEQVQMIADYKNNARGLTSNQREVGIWTYWVNKIHPNPLHIAFVSFKNSLEVTQRIIELAIIQAKKLNKKRIVISGGKFDKQVQSELVKNHFAQMRVTHLVEFKKGINLDGNFETATRISDLNDEQKDNLLNTIVWQYKKVHQINPVANLSVDEWRQLIWSDVILTAPSVMISGNEISAYSIWYQDNQKSCTLAYVWANDPQQLIDLIKVQIRELSGRYALLNGELDSTDDQAMLVYDSFPKEADQPYITWVREIE